MTNQSFSSLQICECGGREVTPTDNMSSSVGCLEVDWLHIQLKGLLEGKGEQGRTVLAKLDKFRDAEQVFHRTQHTSVLSFTKPIIVL